jgi:FdhD protein
MNPTKNRPQSTTPAEVWIVEPSEMRAHCDEVATEEPLEIRLRATGLREGEGPIPVFSRRAQERNERTIAITMRTPGADFELTAGFLHGEGVVRAKEDITCIQYPSDVDLEEDKRHNIVIVDLREGVVPDFKSLERHFYTTSACGVCGKTSLESLRLQGTPRILPGPVVAASVLYGLTEKLQGAQGLFATTGGLHAAGLFDANGQLLGLREDVGRHNALDKLLGWALLQGLLPLREQIVMVSGRSSFEILQKCLMAAVPIVCAVSAPSSLAVDLAREFGITLVGFLRGQRFNVYAHPERLAARG